jgi:hypothetical protein
VLLTAGGSSYFDRVAAKFTPARRGPHTRSCSGRLYLTYDNGFYRTKMRELKQRGGIQTAAVPWIRPRRSSPALELWRWCRRSTIPAPPS